MLTWACVNLIVCLAVTLFWSRKETIFIWTASSEFGTYRLCEQRRFRRACAYAQSRQNLRSSLIQALSQEEPSDRKPDPSPLWMVGHAQLKFVMTECSKTQIRLTGPILSFNFIPLYGIVNFKLAECFTEIIQNLYVSFFTPKSCIKCTNEK